MIKIKALKLKHKLITERKFYLNQFFVNSTDVLEPVTLGTRLKTKLELK